MKNKYGKILLGVLLSIPFGMSAQDLIVDGIRYGIYEEGEDIEETWVGKAYVASNSDASGEIIIPEVVSDYTVVAVEAEAFKSSSMTSLQLPSSVEYIGNSAFSDCKSLEKASLGENSMTLGQSLFQGCSKLREVSLSPLLEVLPANSFSGCESLRSIELPLTVVSIGQQAFKGCSDLNTITLPPALTELPSSIFEQCVNLYNAKLPEGLTSIGKNAFYGCSNLRDVNLPQSVTQIGESAFYNCSNLQVLALPAGLTTIAENMLYGSGVTEINLPYGITTIGKSAFQSCSSLKTITIPESVTLLEEKAFYDCKSLETAYLSSALTLLSPSVFANSGLTSIVIPSKVETIGESAFENCMLSTLTIPESVKLLDNYSFRGCSSLGDVTLGGSVESLGYGVFEKCGKIERIESKNTTPPSITPYTFESSIMNLAFLYVPESAVDAYKSAAEWQKFDKIRAIGNEYVAVEALAIDPEEIVLEEGEIVQLNPVVTPFNATDIEYIWSTSNPDVVELGELGIITAISAGTAIVTVSIKDMDFSASCQVTVTPYRVKVSELVMDRELMDMYIGESEQLDVTVLPAEATGFHLTWTSSDPSVATVEYGLVTALAEGQTIITVTSENDTEASCVVTVFPRQVDLIQLVLNKTELEMEVGDEEQLKVSIVPEDATGYKLTWYTSDPTVVTVEDGLVKAVGPGEAMVVVSSDQGLPASCVITVTQMVEAIELTPEVLDLPEGERYQLVAKIIPENATYKVVEWSTSDDKVAIVSQGGVVWYVGMGTCTITVRALDGSGVSASCQVNGVAGIDDIFAEEGAFNIYSTQGILIRENADKEVLKNLERGLYIIVNGNKSKTIFLED